jgi:polynucleotide 5'-kinase involved in rRNA processing
MIAACVQSLRQISQFSGVVFGKLAPRHVKNHTIHGVAAIG